VSLLEAERPARDVAAFDLEDRQARDLVRGLHQPRPSVYWTDLLVSAALGWGAFALAIGLPFLSAGMLAAVACAVFALYRGLCFVHEISHLNRNALPRFEGIWNALIGFPLLLPSFVYAGVHQSHHKLSTYGTRQDPEYLPFAQCRRMTVLFALESFLIPVALLVRFLILSPMGFVSSRIRRWLVVHASSLTMNVAYRREVTAELERTVTRQSAIIFAGMAGVLALVVWGAIPGRVVLIWLMISSLVSFINTLRTLGAHAYESTGEPRDRKGQLVDSIDTPGAAWTELWAPVGLRYHALHHYFPGIPYHNLPEAYRRVERSLPPQATYRTVVSEGLWRSLRRLYLKGRAAGH
jgi:fatty acid desaturase